MDQGVSLKVPQGQDWELEMRLESDGVETGELLPIDRARIEKCDADSTGWKRSA